MKTYYETRYNGDETITTTIGPKTIEFALREYKRLDNNQSMYILDTDIYIDGKLIESTTSEADGFFTFSELMLAMRNIYIVNSEG